MEQKGNRMLALMEELEERTGRLCLVCRGDQGFAVMNRREIPVQVTLHIQPPLLGDDGLLLPMDVEGYTVEVQGYRRADGRRLSGEELELDSHDPRTDLILDALLALSGPVTVTRQECADALNYLYLLGSGHEEGFRAELEETVYTQGPAQQL